MRFPTCICEKKIKRKWNVLIKMEKLKNNCVMAYYEQKEVKSPRPIS